MKKIYSAPNLPEAKLVLDFLQEAGIEVRLFNENAQGGLGELPFTHAYPEIWIVDPHDEERALALIKDYESVPLQTGQVPCPHCGEDNPAHFLTCWNCGGALAPPG